MRVSPVLSTAVTVCGVMPARNGCGCARMHPRTPGIPGGQVPLSGTPFVHECPFPGTARRRPGPGFRQCRAISALTCFLSLRRSLGPVGAGRPGIQLAWPRRWSRLRGACLQGPGACGAGCGRGQLPTGMGSPPRSTPARSVPPNGRLGRVP